MKITKIALITASVFTLLVAVLLSKKITQTQPIVTDNPKTQVQEQNQDKVLGSQIFVSSGSQGYSAGGVISISSTDEPYVEIQGYELPNEVTIDVYKANEEALFSYLIHDKDNKQLYETPDKSQFTFIASTKQNLKGEAGSNRVNLPIDGNGIWYLQVKGGTNDTHAFVVRSDIGALTKEGNNEFIVWAQSFTTKRSISDASVKVYGLKNAKSELSNSGFNSDGIAVLPVDANADIAVVTKGNDKTLIPLNLQYLNYGYSYSSYAPQQQDIKYFLFTDRPLYKPGDQVFFKSILRDDDDARYTIAQGVARVKIFTDYGTDSLVFDKTYPVSSTGAIAGEWTLPADAKVGWYRLRIESPESQIFSETSFQVEFFRKPDYSVDASIEKTEFVSGDNATFKISGNYFSGQPLSHEKVKYKLHSADFYDYGYYTQVKYYLNDEYRYGYWGGREIKSSEIELDEKGEALVQVDTKLTIDSHRSQVFSLEVEFDNGSGNPSFVRKNIIVYSGEYGIYRQESGSHSSEVNKEFTLPVTLVSRRNKSVSGKSLTAKVTRTNWIREQKPDQKYPNYRQENEDLPDLTAQTDKDGNAVFRLMATKVGSYQFTVSGQDERGNTISQQFWGYVHSADEPYYWENNRGGDITINADKENYKPNDTAQLTIYSATPDRDVFLSLERGRSHRYQVVKMSGKKASVSLPLENFDMPNIYASVASFMGNNLDTNVLNLPVSADSKKLQVSLTSDRKSYGPGDQVTTTVETKDINGNPVSSEVAVWTVDKALFELVDDKLPDIFKTFWNERYNSTTYTHSLQGIQIQMAERGGGCFAEDTQITLPDGSTKEIRNIVVGDRVLSQDETGNGKEVSGTVTAVHKTNVSGYFIVNGSLRVTPEHRLFINGSWQTVSMLQVGDKVREQNGQEVAVESLEWLRGKFEVYNLTVDTYKTFFANGVWAHNQKGGARQTFKDTAYWNPSVRTDVNGKAQVSFKLPDNLTTWVLSAVGATESTMVGQTKSELLVTKDVIVRPILPNVLREGDAARLSAIVQNFTDTDQSFDVTLTFDAGQVKEAKRERVPIKSKESIRLFWEVLPMSQNLKGKVQISAKSTTNKDASDTIISQLPVQLFGFSDTVGQTGEGEKNFAVNLDEDALQKKSSVVVSVAPSILGTLPSAMKYLVDYPYGCVEQTTSRFVPAVIAKANATLLADALEGKNVDDMIEKGAARLSSLQMLDGGWGWWSSGFSNPHISSYVLEYLLEAQKLGAKVDSSMIARAKEFMTRENTTETREEKIARQYGQSLFAQPDKNKVIHDLDGLTPDILALAAIANYRNGETNPASNGITKLIALAKPQGDALYWEKGNRNYYASTDGSTGLAIRAIVATKGDRNIAVKGAQYLLRSRKNYYWSNSFATSQVIRGVVDLSLSGDEQSPKYTYSVDLDGTTIAQGTVTNARQIVKPITLPIEKIKKEGSVVTISKSGDGQIYSTLVIEQFHTSKETKALSNGISVKREYVNAKGAEYNIAVGDVVNVNITVDGLNTDENYGVIEDQLPAGLIPVNESFKNQQFQYDRNAYYNYWGVTDREYSENGVVLSLYQFHAGSQTHTYKAIAVTGGSFSVPPVKAELMYAPEISGRSEASTLVIADESKIDPTKLISKAADLTKAAINTKVLIPAILFLVVLIVSLAIFMKKRNIQVRELFYKMKQKIQRGKGGDNLPQDIPHDEQKPIV